MDVADKPAMSDKGTESGDVGGRRSPLSVGAIFISTTTSLNNRDATPDSTPSAVAGLNSKMYAEEYVQPARHPVQDYSHSCLSET